MTWGEIAIGNEYVILFRGEGNVLKQSVVVVAQSYEDNKNSKLYTLHG